MPKLTLINSSIRRRTYYPIISVPPYTTRNTFYRRIRWSNGKGVSPYSFLFSVHLTLSLLHLTTPRSASFACGSR